MIFESTPLSDAILIKQDEFADVRGHFARFWSYTEFAANGIDFVPTESNLSYNALAHTLRGMHFQDSEAAIVFLL